MRVVVTGGRNYQNKLAAYKVLDHIHQQYGISFIIQGDAKGADRIAKQWAQDRGVPLLNCPADWDDIEAPNAVIRTRADGKKYNALAGLWRNQTMIDFGKPDICIAFPGGTGTADMVERCNKAKLKVIKVSK